MQKVNILCVGKLKEKFYAEAVAEYSKRLKRHCTLEIIELPESRLPDDPSPAEIRQALAAEAALIEARLPKGGAVIAMCIEGKQMSSEDFADHIENVTQTASCICFIIGSSHGLSDRVKRAADYKLSLSKMTFPHQLFRVMLLESVYRAFNIIKGTKYHK